MILKLAFLLNFIAACSCQDFKWAWLGGSKSALITSDELGPGARSGSVVWKQNDGTIWMFGGATHNSNNQLVLLNDLWKLDLAMNKWTLINGPSAVKDGKTVPPPRQLAAGCGFGSAVFIVYGGLDDTGNGLADTWVYYIFENRWFTLLEMQIKMGNVSASLTPGAHGDSAWWCNSEKLVIFGGVDHEKKLRRDMWIFSMVSLSWSEAKVSVNLPKDETFASVFEYPSQRSGATTWISRDKLYLFGGNVQNGNHRSNHFNYGYSTDMWEYDPGSDSWKALKGSSELCSTVGSYRMVGLPLENNLPGCRRKAAAWTDAKNNLWMFGGEGVDGNPESISHTAKSRLLNDIWHFDVERRVWTWKGGPKMGDMGGLYGIKGEPESRNLPGSRCEAAAWTLYGKTFYLYGGLGHDEKAAGGLLSDLWTLDIHRDQQVQLNAPYPASVFGIIFMALALVVLISVLFFFVRGTVKSHSNKSALSGKGVEYLRLINNSDI
ncbi:hypothetical protein CHS0354_015525 [Potamilus streckersoni]|uniref:Uncharacterized protein n=1 Tax=Potamilus streckersoni TaxID=2493646 RepID=A0AAE0W6X9_9BIVA|nr:hypothetical protein CHS0354_015525 [Potamilus streckersoni]